MIKALLEYQSADKKLKDIENRLASSEERKKAMTAKKYLESVEENVNKLDIRAAELVAAYEKATEEQIKLKEQENEINNALGDMEDENAASYLIKKAEELISKIKALGTKASKIAEEIQGILKEFASIKATSKKAKEQYAENSAKYNELKASVKDEKDAVEKELLDLKAKVDPELMARYEDKRSKKMYPILHEVKGNLCGACRMELPSVALSKLAKGEVIDCDQCGRLLYQTQK